MKKSLGVSRRRILVAGLSSALVGCAPTIPPNAFQVSDALLKQRQLQSRRYVGIAEEEVIVASSNVLQDMGYNLEDSEVELGVVTASKDRDATNAGEVVGAIVMAVLFGASTPISKSQKIRVSLVVQPAGTESVIAPTYAGGKGSTMLEATKEAVKQLPEQTKQEVVEQTKVLGEFVVRVTFQRVVTRTDNSVYVETIDEPEIYQEFFDKLSKSVFLEAQEV